MLEVEMECIKRGGRWKSRAGNECGMGLAYHMKQMQMIIHPEKSWHKWNELLVKEFSEKRFIGIMGPASSGKTREAADFVRMMYYCFPRGLTVMVSSTEREMLEMRVWGEIKKYHREAQERFPELPGYLIESKQRIITDNKMEYSEGRDFRDGLCGIPVKKGGAYQGLGSIAGAKNKQMILVADELAFMPKAFIDAISNMNKNPGFKCIGIGNPKDETDALGLLCEPATEHGGWQGGIDQTGGTKTWNIRFPKGVCVQLVGPDSPNFDSPAEEPPPYPFLITREAIAADKAFYGEDSHQYRMMDEGRMPRGVGNRRVITRTLCEKHHALEPVTWKDTNQFKIGFMDAAYSAVGGDRCVFGELRFGLGQDDNNDWKQIMALVDTVVVPVSGKVGDSPEDQIAHWTMNACDERGILPQDFFFDGTGRSSLTSAFARIWSPNVQPVEFGGRPSERLVSRQIKVACSKYYSKFVTELWWSVRLIIETGQFRGLTPDVMAEGSMREWGFVSGNRIEVETKDKMKVRVGRSPDLFDALVSGVEGARRRGFVIENIGAKASNTGSLWISKLLEKGRKLRSSGQLSYAN